MKAIIEKRITVKDRNNYPNSYFEAADYVETVIFFLGIPIYRKVENLSGN